MPSVIDRFSTLGGMAVIVGWSSEYQPGRDLVVIQNGSELQTVTVPVERPDVAVHFGEEAKLWGFRTYGISQDNHIAATQIGLRFPSGVSIDCVSAVNPHVYDNPYALWPEFIKEVNDTGGTVLEIGSRARSGNIVRKQFTSNVKYLGVDVTAGENVDVVCDAHQLSDFVEPPIDYVFSVSTFEHFIMPWKVVLEINKVLRMGGKVFSHSHQTWPNHDEPWDYFRFSRESWSGLFNKHTGFKLCDARRGDGLTVISNYNMGGPYLNMEHSFGYGMSVCLAEKTSKPLVSWNAKVSDIQKIEYNY